MEAVELGGHPFCLAVQWHPEWLTHQRWTQDLFAPLSTPPPSATQRQRQRDNPNLAPIGVFDSGVGGLSVLRALAARLPDELVIYVADQAHVPYGPRTLEQVRRFSEGIARFLLARAPSSSSWPAIRRPPRRFRTFEPRFPDVPFVGMEPAVKPAAEETHTASSACSPRRPPSRARCTPRSSSDLRAGVTLLKDTCPGLVEQIEAGDLDGPETRRILERALIPMLAQGIDTVVLACTHFPFVIPLIQEIVGERKCG